MLSAGETITWLSYFYVFVTTKVCLGCSNVRALLLRCAGVCLCVAVVSVRLGASVSAVLGTASLCEPCQLGSVAERLSAFV